MNELHLEPLTLADAKKVFAWRNDPTIVRLSSSQKIVSWEEHEAWIKNSIDTPLRKVFIIYDGKTAIGQLRFDRIDKSGNAAISVYLLNEFTGLGFGVQAIKSGIDLIFSMWKDLSEIFAFVRKDNLPSQKAFIKSGFRITSGNDHTIDDHLSFTIKNNAR